jgi:hypothetical protein
VNNLPEEWARRNLQPLPSCSPRPIRSCCCCAAFSPNGLRKPPGRGRFWLTRFRRCPQTLFGAPTLLERKRGKPVRDDKSEQKERAQPDSFQRRKLKGPRQRCVDGRGNVPTTQDQAGAFVEQKTAATPDEELKIPAACPVYRAMGLGSQSGSHGSPQGWRWSALSNSSRWFARQDSESTTANS